jgi:hypothetical protein
MLSAHCFSILLFCYVLLYVDLFTLGFLNMQMTNLYFEIEIHSGGQFERNPELVYLGGKVSTYPKVDPDHLSYFEIQDMVVECGSPSTSLVYYLIPGGSLEQGLRLVTGDDEVLYMCELHDAWPIDRITLYVEGGVEPLQVVGQSDFGGVVDEGDEVEGDWMSRDDELEGDELQGDELNEGDEGNVFDNAFKGDELNELVSYDWMNDGLKGADFANDIFRRNEDEDDNEVVGNGGILQVMLSHQCRLRLGTMGGIMQVMLSHQCNLRLGAVGGIMQVMLSHQCSRRLGAMEGIMHSLELGAMRVIMHSLKLGIMHNQQWE